MNYYWLVACRARLVIQSWRLQPSLYPSEHAHKRQKSSKKNAVEHVSPSALGYSSSAHTLQRPTYRYNEHIPMLIRHLASFVRNGDAVGTSHARALVAFAENVSEIFFFGRQQRRGSERP